LNAGLPDPVNDLLMTDRVGRTAGPSAACRPYTQTSAVHCSGIGLTPVGVAIEPLQEIEMRPSAFIARGVALACALGAAALPALPAVAHQATSAPARWSSGDSTPAQRKATLTKEINAAYAEQQSQCKRQPASQRSACLKEARTTYQHDLASMPRLLAGAPAGSISERVVSTSIGTADRPVPAGGASAVGGSGSTGFTGSGSVDAIPPASTQSGGVPPPVDQPDPAQPTTPPQGNPPPAQQ
jgi:hypothetical protein